jgi:hypothetical protein
MEQRGLDTCGTEITILSSHGYLNLAKVNVNSFGITKLPSAYRHLVEKF